MDALLLNDQEASRLLGISRSRFHVLVANGHIPRLKIGRSARYRRVDLLAFVGRLALDAGGWATADLALPPATEATDTPVRTR